MRRWTIERSSEEMQARLRWWDDASPQGTIALFQDFEAMWMLNLRSRTYRPAVEPGL